MPDISPHVAGRVAWRTPEHALNGLIDAACVSVTRYGCIVRYVDDRDLRRYVDPAPAAPDTTDTTLRTLSDYRAPRPLLVGTVAAPGMRTCLSEVLISRQVLRALRSGAPDALSEAYAVASGIVAVAARCATVARLGEPVAQFVCTATGDGAYSVQQRPPQPRYMPALSHQQRLWQTAAGYN